MARPARHRFTVGEFHRLLAGAVLAGDQRVELVQGEIVEMPAPASPHTARAEALHRLLRDRLGHRASVSVQPPVALSPESEPRPDVAVLPVGGFDGPGDVLLLIEVADTTADWDRDHKIPLYAAAGVPEVWLVDPTAGTVEAWWEPEDSGYCQLRPAGRGDTLTPRAFPDLDIPVDELLS